MRRVCGISRLQKTLGLVLVLPKPRHINLRSLAPPHAYLQSLAAIMSTNLPKLSVPQGISKRHAQEQVRYYKLILYEPAMIPSCSHVMCL